jgi:adenylate cyclase
MSEIIAEHGGTVIEFIGDAIMALFGAPFVHDDDPQRAVACAAHMQQELEKFNAEGAGRGLPPLQMGVGINTGSVIVGNIGSEKRMKYGVVGDDVNLAARVESFTVGGEVLVSEETRNAAGDLAKYRGPIEVQAKGKKDALKLYAVVAIGPPYNLLVPGEHQDEETMAEVSLPVDCFKISGKEVAQTPLKAKLIRLGTDGLELELGEELTVYEDIKLRIYPGNGGGKTPIDEVYAKVLRSSREGEACRCGLRFTSITDRQREWLEGQVPTGK